MGLSSHFRSDFKAYLELAARHSEVLQTIREAHDVQLRLVRELTATINRLIAEIRNNLFSAAPEYVVEVDGISYLIVERPDDIDVSTAFPSYIRKVAAVR